MHLICDNPIALFIASNLVFSEMTKHRGRISFHNRKVDIITRFVNSGKHNKHIHQAYKRRTYDKYALARRKSFIIWK